MFTRPSDAPLKLATGSVLEAFAEVRRKVRQMSGTDKGVDPVVVDIDATLVEVHSENKEETAPNYKGASAFIQFS